MSSFVRTVFALTLLILGASATTPCCTKLPYALFAPLSKHAPAQSFCTKKYPIPRPTCFVTATVPSTKTLPATTTVIPITVMQTVTTGQASTTVVTDTVTPTAVIITEASTVVATVTTCAPTFTKRTNNNDNDKLAPIFSSLQKQASSFVQTLCSCIETTPGCSTSTVTTRPTISITKTATTTVIPTSTILEQNTVVVTIHTTLTLPQPTATTTTTTTSTSTYCPPPAAQTTCAGGVRPDKCSPDFFCGPNQSCVCLKSIEGDVVCGDVNVITASCSDVVPCQTTADCGSDQMCVTNLCCSDKQCITVKRDTCPNGQAVSRLFRAGPAKAGARGGNFPPASSK